MVSLNRGGGIEGFGAACVGGLHAPYHGVGGPRYARCVLGAVAIDFHSPKGEVHVRHGELREHPDALRRSAKMPLYAALALCTALSPMSGLAQEGSPQTKDQRSLLIPHSQTLNLDNDPVCDPLRGETTAESCEMAVEIVKSHLAVLELRKPFLPPDEYVKHC